MSGFKFSYLDFICIGVNSEALTGDMTWKAVQYFFLLAFVTVGHLEAADVAFALENLRDFNLEPRRRNLHARMARVHRVPDSREHVCDRVSHKSAFLRPCGPGAPRLSGPAY